MKSEKGVFFLRRCVRILRLFSLRRNRDWYRTAQGFEEELVS